MKQNKHQEMSLLEAGSQPASLSQGGEQAYARAGSHPKLLRLPSVITRTGRSRSSIYAAMKLGEFPKSIQLSARCVGWLESDVDEWISNCVEVSRG